MARGKRNGTGKGSPDFVEDPPVVHGNGHNSNRAERLAAQDKAIAEWCKLQDREDALLEQHVGPIRKKKNKLKSDLKSLYGVPTEAFNARAALRRIELTGSDEVVLAVNELLEATPVGKNIDLVVLAERVAVKVKEKAEKAAKGKNTEAAA